MHPYCCNNQRCQTKSALKDVWFSLIARLRKTCKLFLFIQKQYDWQTQEWSHAYISFVSEMRDYGVGFTKLWVSTKKDAIRKQRSLVVLLCWSNSSISSGSKIISRLREDGEISLVKLASYRWENCLCGAWWKRIFDHD